MLVVAGVEVHPLQGAEVGFCLEAVAGTDVRRNPSAADVEGFALDALVGPQRYLGIRGVGQADFEGGVGEGQGTCVQSGAAPVPGRNDAIGGEAIETVADPGLGEQGTKGGVGGGKPETTGLDLQRVGGLVRHMEDEGVRSDSVGGAQEGQGGNPGGGIRDGDGDGLGLWLARDGKQHVRRGVGAPRGAFAVPGPDGQCPRRNLERLAAPGGGEIVPGPVV